MFECFAHMLVVVMERGGVKKVEVSSEMARTM